MHRRTFLQLSATLAACVPWVHACTAKPVIGGRIVGASASAGHLLRGEISYQQPGTTENLEVVIVGAGVSGLSAARMLQQNGVQSFAVLDLEQKAGGNAASGYNAVSAYPWGAHYVPTPNNNLSEYLQFLQECGVITGYDPEGLPIYNEYHLCFDPQDRLYINGRWQEGLVPRHGVPAQELQQTERFLQLMDQFRYVTGKDGKDAFAIPADQSSKDETFTRLDSITMKQWLVENDFTAPSLHWYVNYCTRDDFGTPHHLASAWAGIHYFASRKGRGANAAPQDVLTWPEGNGWLVQQLQKTTTDRIRVGSMVLRVQQQEDGVLVDYMETTSKLTRRILAKQVIMAVPQFVAARLLGDAKRRELVDTHLLYMPWMVANLTVSNLEERSGAPRSWDNVLYESESLGYVVASHQSVAQHHPKRNLTYYRPLTQKSTKEARMQAYGKTHEEWVQMVMSDLKKVHPNIEAATENIDVMIWGHAMVQPLPGLMQGGIRHQLAASIEDRIHFAHTDLAGISIFEEGFYQGLQAANKVLHHAHRTA